MKTLQNHSLPVATACNNTVLLASSRSLVLSACIFLLPRLACTGITTIFPACSSSKDISLRRAGFALQAAGYTETQVRGRE